MGCIKNPLKICSRRGTRVALFCTSLLLLFADISFAAVASKFSLSVGEQYTDNVFFSKNKEHDFITVITPKLSILYAPQGEPIPTLNFNISPSAQIFARHSELNNFGDNISLNAGFTQRFSPRLSVHVSDSLARSGDSRTGDSVFGDDGLLTTPTSQ